MRVYLDNAATTPMLPEVLEAMMPYLTDYQGNPSSVHGHGREVRAALEKARKEVAAAIGCSPAEIVFTSGGTEADNMAIKGAVTAGKVQRIITSPLEHHAVLHAAEQCEKHHGTQLVLLTVDEKGNPDLDELESLLADGTPTLVTLMHANNEIGTLLDLQKVGEICKTHSALFHTDAVQSVGHLPITVSEINVHYLSASAHKFNGPKGAGFLYRRADAPVLPSLIAGGGQERNQRAGTENVPSIMGMAFALSLAVENLEKHVTHIQGLKDYFKEKLQVLIPNVTFNGETEAGKSLPTVLNVAFPGQDEESMLLMNLDIYQVSASGGSACSSGSVNPSHVLAGCGHNKARMANSVRFSFGPQNKKEEIDYVLEKLAVMLAEHVNT